MTATDVWALLVAGGAVGEPLSVLLLVWLAWTDTMARRGAVREVSGLR